MSIIKKDEAGFIMPQKPLKLEQSLWDRHIETNLTHMTQSGIYRINPFGIKLDDKHDFINIMINSPLTNIFSIFNFEELAKENLELDLTYYKPKENSLKKSLKFNTNGGKYNIKDQYGRLKEFDWNKNIFTSDDFLPYFLKRYDEQLKKTNNSNFINNASPNFEEKKVPGSGEEYIDFDKNENWKKAFNF